MDSMSDCQSIASAITTASIALSIGIVALVVAILNRSGWS